MKVNEKIHVGIKALKKNEFQNAQKIFEDLLNEQPMNAEVNHFLGITFQLLNEINKAKIYYEKSIQIKPNFAEAHKDLGNIFYKIGEIYKAESCYIKSLKINPKLTEAKTNLSVVLEQKKVDFWFSKNIESLQKNQKKKNLNPYITERKVESELLNQLYKIHMIKLNDTQDVRFGNGKCSSNMKLFENKNEIIRMMADDIINILQKKIGSKIYVMDSFVNILQTGSGTKPHKHLDPFDKKTGLEKKKYSLTYYISVGDQTGKEPGILKLYNPDKEILPSNGTMIVIPSGRAHSSSYDGKKDRVMIGANFYSLI